MCGCTVKRLIHGCCDLWRAVWFCVVGCAHIYPSQTPQGLYKAV